LEAGIHDGAQCSLRRKGETVETETPTDLRDADSRDRGTPRLWWHRTFLLHDKLFENMKIISKVLD
jgi:hypothetical protein